MEVIYLPLKIFTNYVEKDEVVRDLSSQNVPPVRQNRTQM